MTDTNSQFNGAGVYPLMSNEAYHALLAVGSSGIKEAVYTAATYEKKYLAEPDADEPEEREARAMLLGTALHCIILEPEMFAVRYLQTPQDAPKRPSAASYQAKTNKPEVAAAMEWWAVFDAQAAGRIVLNKKDWDAVQKAKTILLANATVRGMLSRGLAEVSYFAHCPQTGLLLKSRPDWTMDDGARDPDGVRQVDMADLKSTLKPYGLTVDAWKRHCKSNGYFIQTAHHGDVMELAAAEAGDPVRVVNRFHIAYSFTDELCRVFRISDLQTQNGRSRVQEGIQRIADGMATGNWPGFPDDIADLPDSSFDAQEIE